jgi:hypothetical protein
MKKLKTNHVEKLYNQLSTTESGIREIVFNQKMANNIFDSHYDKVLEHNKNISFWSIVETLLMGFILLFQLFYIKSQVEN